MSRSWIWRDEPSSFIDDMATIYVNVYRSMVRKVILTTFSSLPVLVRSIRIIGSFWRYHLRFMTSPYTLFVLSVLYLLSLPGPHLNIKTVFPGMGIPMLKIRRSRDRLIFNIRLLILIRRHLCIDTTRWSTILPPRDRWGISANRYYISGISVYFPCVNFMRQRSILWNRLRVIL